MPQSDTTPLYSLPDLQELRAILGDLFPDLPGVVYRCRNNRSWTMLDLGDAVLELTGYSPRALLNDAELSWAQLIHPDDRARVLDEVRTALEDGLPFRTSYRIVHASGEDRRVWEQGRLAGDGSGELVGFIQDVTEWRKQWKQLDASAQLLERTVASLEEAVLVIDTSGRGRGILRANRAACRMFGYSMEELVGSNTEKLHVSRESFLEFATELEPVLEERGVVHAAYPMRRKDGTEFAAEQTVTLLEPDRGIAGGAVSVVRDVSERQTLRKQLNQSQRLEAIGRLAGGVAHDFNNLLTVIRAHSDFLLLEPDMKEPWAEEIRAIQSAADAAADLTSQLLAFGREQVLRPTVVDLNAVVHRVERLVERVLEENIELSIRTDPEPLHLAVDATQLEQAVLNLVVNARDAMPEGGTLTLTTRREPAPGSEPGSTGDAPSRVLLAVSDTGEGMDPDTLSRIFEPFYTTKPQGRGTGLGLATAYGFVSQSGGTIEVDSEPGEGSTFTLQFPATDTSPDPRPASVARTGGSIQERAVLVVEDDGNVRRVIEKALGRVGCRVSAVETGEEALERVRAGGDEMDLLITDLVLPGITGREVAEQLLDRSPDTPIIIMSGYAAPAPDGDAGIPPQASFLEKPFTISELLDRVRESLNADPDPLRSDTAP